MTESQKTRVFLHTYHAITESNTSTDKNVFQSLSTVVFVLYHLARGTDRSTLYSAAACSGEGTPAAAKFTMATRSTRTENTPVTQFCWQKRRKIAKSDRERTGDTWTFHLRVLLLNVHVKHLFWQKKNNQNLYKYATLLSVNSIKCYPLCQFGAHYHYGIWYLFCIIAFQTAMYNTKLCETKFDRKRTITKRLTPKQTPRQKTTNRSEKSLHD